MRTSMVYPIRFWAMVLTGLLLYQFSTEAAADWCKFEKDINVTLDLASSETLAIKAAAGDLDVVGVSDSNQAVVTGKVCVSKEAWLEESSISTSSGKHAEIAVDLPNTDGGWTNWGNNYASLDLRVEVPEDLSLEIKDSSGDVFLKNIASAELAAEDVAGFDTDYVEWDKLENELRNVPANLSKWASVTEDAPRK